MIRISSQIMAPSTTTRKTGVAPTKTLANPALPGKNGRFSSCQICSPIARQAEHQRDRGAALPGALVARP